MRRTTTPHMLKKKAYLAAHVLLLSRKATALSVGLVVHGGGQRRRTTDESNKQRRVGVGAWDLEARQRTRTPSCENLLRSCSHMAIWPGAFKNPPLNSAEVDLVAAGGPQAWDPMVLSIPSTGLDYSGSRTAALDWTT